MPSSSKDYYQILGIPRDADEEAIKSAYKKQALKWHPDRNLDKKEEAERRFKELAEAYEVLSDKQKRTIYDQYGEAGLKGGVPTDGANGFAGGFPAGGFKFTSSTAHGAEDIFSQFFASQGIDPFASFGFGGGRPGGRSNVRMSGMGGMPGMNGMGGMPGGFSFMDVDGEGFGQSRSPEDLSVKKRLACTLEEIYTGATKKMKVTRKRVDGTTDEKVLVINIKPGWKAGTKITFNNDGDEIAPGTFQNIVFSLEEKPHSVFKREGDNLTCTLDISLTEALTGFTKYITTLDNRRLPITSETVIEPSTVRRISGEGMPISKNPGQKGDLLVKFNIHFPHSLTANQKQLIKNAQL